jgi:hypothetical protein
MSNLKMLLVLLVRVMSMNMSMQAMKGKDGITEGKDSTMVGKDGTTEGEDGTTDGVVTGTMSIPDIAGITINTIIGLRITSSGFYVSSVASTWATQMI